MKNFWEELKKPIVALAPMEGVTDTAFRQIAKRHGADVVYTEFISTDAIGHNAQRAFAKMDFAETEQPVICQIFGKDPKMFVAAAREIEKRGFAGIDINFGCPAHKVVGSGAGVALLRRPDYARKLIEAVLEEVSIPVSLKVRAKIRKERKEVAPDIPEYHTASDLVEAIRGLPVSAIMVHGRSYESGFSGEVDVRMIRAVKEQFPGLVLANGGIMRPEDARAMLTQTGADGVGIARGAQGNPWILQQIKDVLKTGTSTAPSWEEVTATALEHAKLMESAKGRRGILEMRKHLAWYVKGVPGASRMRQGLVRVESIAQIEKLLRRRSP